jgi:hypothetical protein
MMKQKLETYALVVCFLAVLNIVISFGIASYAIIGVFSPELTMETDDYNVYQSNTSYWNSLRSSCYDSDDENDKKQDKKEVKPPEEELTKQRLEAFSIAVKNEKRDCIQSITQELMYILTSVIALLIFWKIARKAKEPL